MAKTNNIKQYINGEIIDADEMNQNIENAGAEGGVIPYDPSNQNRSTDGLQPLGSSDYPFGDIFFNKDKKFKSVNASTHAVDQEFTFAEIMQFIKKTDTPASYAGEAEKFLVVNSGETAVEFSTSPSKSNVLFCATLGGDFGSSTTYGFTTNTASATHLNAAWFNSSSTYQTVIRWRWKKIPGVTTARFFAYLKGTSGAGGDLFVQVSIGGQTGAASIASASALSAYTKVSATVDVSALSDGTEYDVLIQLKTAVGTCFMDAISIEGE